MKVELINLDQVIPYHRNPRKNAPVDRVAAAIKEYGWRQPIVVDKDMVIIVGHTRYAAAKKLGLTEAPVHIAGELTPAQAKAYRIADNKLNEDADWDPDLLRLEFDDLSLEGFDLDLTGFGDKEIAKLNSGQTVNETTEDPDAIPLVGEPVSVPGDLYEIGPHRLLCGDSTVVTDVEKLMGGGLCGYGTY